MTTLDDTIGPYLPFDHIDLLKLDVEGEEGLHWEYGYKLQPSFCSVHACIHTDRQADRQTDRHKLHYTTLHYITLRYVTLHYKHRIK